MLRKSKLVGIGISLIGGGVGICVIALMLGAHAGVSFGPGGINLGPQIVETLQNQRDDEKTNYVGNRQNVEHGILPEFKEMSLKIGLSDVNIVAGEDYSIEIDMYKDIPIHYEVKGDTLYVEQDSNKLNGINLGYMDAKQGNITISIPKDTVLQNNKIDTGVGDWWINGIEMKNLDMRIGVGEVNLGDVKATKLEITGGVGDVVLDTITSDELIVTGGMGDIEGENLNVRKLNVAAGVGDVDLEGRFAGDVHATGGLGNLNLTTEINAKEYNYHITKGLGTLSLNGTKISGMETYVQNNEGQYEMKVESGMGDIRIKTREWE